MKAVIASNEAYLRRERENLIKEGYYDQEINEARSNFSMKRILEMQRQLKQLQSQINSKNNEITQLKQENNDIKIQLEEKKSENESLVHQLNEIQGLIQYNTDS